MPYPTPSTSPVSSRFFGDTISAGKTYFQSLMESVDPQRIMPIAAFAATLGLGTAALYFGHQTSCSMEGDQPPVAAPTKTTTTTAILPVKRKSRTLRRNTKSKLISFQNKSQHPENPMPQMGHQEKIRPVVSSISDVTVAAAQRVQNKPISVEPEPVQIGDVGVKSEEPKNNNLVLKQCPRGRKTPCIAPFPLKLETFLRVHKLKYELDFNGHEPRLYGSPWIRFNTEDITESQNVLNFLMDQYHLKLEKELSAKQRSMATAYTHLLENHLYWGIALWRWVYDGARSLKEIQLLPRKTQELIPDVCKTVEQAAWFHGIGKMTPNEVKRAVLQDLRSLSEFLGSKSYFLGTDEPTELDCTAFGMLAQFMWNMHGPFHMAVVNTYKNLNDFCWRIRLNYWPDWEDCLNNTQFYNEEPYPTAESIDYPF